MNRSLITTFLVIFLVINWSSSGHPNSNSQQESNKDSEEKANKLYEKAVILLSKSKKDLKKAYSLLQESSQLNHIGSKELMAKGHLFGDHLPLDLIKAYQYFESIPTNHSSDAHLFLGFLHTKSLNDLISTTPLLKVNEVLATKHYQMAQQLGNPLAKMAIAFRYYYGLGSDRNCEKALRLYRSVAIDVVEQSKISGGSPLQDYRLWESKSTLAFMNNVIHYYMFLAKGGDMIATIALGHLFYYGSFKVKMDRKRAFNYFTRASKTGNGNALAFLAKYYLEGSPPVTRNHTKGLELLMMAVTKDNPIAMTDLGLMYLEGKGIEQDIPKAQKYLSLASRNGWVEGIVQTGISYMTGSTGFKDYRKAFSTFQLAEKSKHLLALYNLGQMHATGIGTVKSCARAVPYFKSVAERGGWAENLFRPIDNYEKGLVREAIVQLAFMSEVGYELAQSNLAYILEKSLINKRKMSSVLKYWMRSAAQGSSYSRIKVGDYFYYGLGTPVDYQMAVIYYRKASEFRYSAQALFNLGYLHEKGLGVKQDTRTARLYYSMAATIDDEAKVPTFLAKTKLGFNEMVQEFVERVSKIKNNLSKNWDLILLVVLVVLLCYVLYLKLCGF